MLGTSGDASMHISQALLCYRDKNTKSEKPSLLNQKNGCRKNGRTVHKNFFFFLGAIEMSATQFKHAGRYTCVARNAAGSAHRHVTLRVQGMKVTFH